MPTFTSAVGDDVKLFVSLGVCVWGGIIQQSCMVFLTASERKEGGKKFFYYLYLAYISP